MLSRSLVAFVAASALLCVCLSAPVLGQAPNPPPIWPSQFLARFGLYMFDVPSESPIFNATAEFYYNSDVMGQLINYEDRCVPVLPGGDQSSCKILFKKAGIFWQQPALNVDCCMLIPFVGPTPRNFTRGFNWNGTATAPDYYGTERESDFYISDDKTFKYWTEVETHHDVFFRDGSGAFWAWDHLNVTEVPPETFDLFVPPLQCVHLCASLLNLDDTETSAMHERARNTGMIQLALHHHELQMREEEEARRALDAKAHEAAKPNHHAHAPPPHTHTRRHHKQLH